MIFSGFRYWVLMMQFENRQKFAKKYIVRAFLSARLSLKTYSLLMAMAHWVVNAYILYIYIYIHTYIYIYTHTHIYIHIYIYQRIYIYTHIHKVAIYMYTYAHTHTQMHVHIHINIYMHTGLNKLCTWWRACAQQAHKEVFACTKLGARKSIIHIQSINSINHKGHSKSSWCDTWRIET